MRAKWERVLVTGAGVFIGHHLVTYLKERGYWVCGVDLIDFALGSVAAPENRPPSLATESVTPSLLRWLTVCSNKRQRTFLKAKSSGTA